MNDVMEFLQALESFLVLSPTRFLDHIDGNMTEQYQIKNLKNRKGPSCKIEPAGVAQRDN